MAHQSSHQTLGKCPDLSPGGNVTIRVLTALPRRGNRSQPNKTQIAHLYFRSIQPAKIEQRLRGAGGGKPAHNVSAGWLGSVERPLRGRLLKGRAQTMASVR